MRRQSIAVLTAGIVLSAVFAPPVRAGITGNALDYPLGITVDNTGNAYVTGDYSDNAFKITPSGVITEIIDSTDDVDFQDFAALASKWPEVDCNEPDWCSRADIDFSGDVGFSDLKILTENWLEGI